MRRTGTLVLIFILGACARHVPPQVLPRLAGGPGPQHALVFPALASSWDEGLPLGNAMLGELLWANGPFVRFSLDRADLWDLRPMRNLDGPQWKYRWVVDQWKKGDYRPVQERFDVPYDAEPAPSKIPAAALEWNASSWGDPFEARLTIESATATVRWKNGTILETFVQAGEPVGWIRLKGAPADFKPVLRMPPYAAPDAAGAVDPVTGQDLRRLGYKQGAVRENEDFLIYRQDGWGGFYYDVAVGWRRPAPGVVEIAWSASSRFSDEERQPGAADRVLGRLAARIRGVLGRARGLVDGLLVALRRPPAGPAIGKTMVSRAVQIRVGRPPRRPADQPAGRLDRGQRQAAAVEGRFPPRPQYPAQLLALLFRRPPGGGARVSRLAVGPAGGIQGLHQGLLRDGRASTCRGVSDAGRAAHGRLDPVFVLPHGRGLAGPAPFYLHWRFSRDRRFWRNGPIPRSRTWPSISSSFRSSAGQGRRRLPASSSPEIFDNSAKAWFAETTNYDLALIRWTFGKAAELAGELGEKRRSRALAGRSSAEWPELAVDPGGRLDVRAGVPTPNRTGTSPT